MFKRKKWRRKNFPTSERPKLNLDRIRIRQQAERESTQDLQKPIEQLLSDVWEEILQEFHSDYTDKENKEIEKIKYTESPEEFKRLRLLDEIKYKLDRIMHSNKRMVSMMARVALSNDRTSRRLLILTWILAVLTSVLAVMTFVLLLKPQ